MKTDHPEKISKFYFAVQVIPPRPTFSQDMSVEERSTMQQHVVYWKELMAKGQVVVFGPVLNPTGAYGLGIISVEEEQQIKDIIAKDPANGLNRYIYHPMLAIVPSDLP